MRVATRRMRAALRVFAPYLDERRHASRSSAGSSAPAVPRRRARPRRVPREDDASTLTRCPGRGTATSIRCSTSGAGEHEQARAETARVLRRRSLSALRRDLHRRCSTTRERAALPFVDRRRRGAPAPRRPRPAGRPLRPRRRACGPTTMSSTGHDTPLRALPSPAHRRQGDALHVRVLRGGPGPEAKPLISATKGMQDHLGDLQDAVVTCDILRNFLDLGQLGAAGRQRAARDDDDGRARRGRLPGRPPGRAQPPGRHLPRDVGRDPRRGLQPASGARRWASCSATSGEAARRPSRRWSPSRYVKRRRMAFSIDVRQFSRPQSSSWPGHLSEVQHELAARTAV